MTYAPDGRLAMESVALTGWREVEQSYTYHEDGSLHVQNRVVRDDEGVVLGAFRRRQLHDAYGRVASIELGNSEGEPSARLVLHYDNEGRVDNVSIARVGAVASSDATVAMLYDDATHRLTGYAQDQLGYADLGADACVMSYKWRLNERGLVAEETFETVDQSRRSYEYDPRGFLVGAADEIQAATYEYNDPTGVLTFVNDISGSGAVEYGQDEIVARDRIYGLDALGRVVSRTRQPIDGPIAHQPSDEDAGGTTWRYGPTGDAALASGPWGFAEFGYDEAHQRILKKRNGSFASAHVLGGYVEDAAFIEPLRVGGVLVGVVHNGELLLLGADGRGTVVVGADGEYQSATPYGSRGKRPPLSRVLDFAGAGYDGDTQTVRFGVRDYDPYLGGWLSTDGLFMRRPRLCLQRPEECNGRGYAGGDPISYLDPTGMYKEVADVVVHRQEDGSKHISFTFTDREGRGSGYLTSVEVMDGKALWRDGASGKRMRAPLAQFLDENSYAVYYDSRANGGFGGHEVQGGFFADSVIERYHETFFWNRVANTGDAMGAVAIGLSLPPEPTALCKAAALALGSVSAIISTGTSARAWYLARGAAENLRQFGNTAGQAGAGIVGAKGGAGGLSAGAVAVGASQLQQFFGTVRAISAINNDSLSSR
jgi:RHS repeat-associated protein